MDAETVQNLKDCESLLAELDQSAYTRVVSQAQTILSENVKIISDISELRLAGESGGSEGAEGVPSAAEGGDVAVLLQQLNFNLNEVVKLYQDAKSK